MAIDFPGSPTIGQEVTIGAVVYKWDGTKWTAVPAGIAAGTKIEISNTKAEIIDTGSDGRFVVTTEGVERLRINSGGAAAFTAGTAALPAITTAADLNTGIFFPAADTVAISEGGAEALRVDNSGRLLVGTTSARNTANGVSAGFQVEGLGGAGAVSIIRNGGLAYLTLGRSGAETIGSNAIISNGDELGRISWAAADGTDIQSWSAQISAEIDGVPGSNDVPGRLVFSTTADGAATPTERMRITNYGGTFFNTTGTPTVNANFGVTIGQFNGAARAGTILAAANFDGSSFIAAFHGTVGYTQIMGDGDLENTNNRYTGISDIKLKQNVEDSTSQWNDLKAVRVRKYELKAHPDRKHIGVIAQELEQVCPGLVIEREGRDGETYKSVAYSVLYMKAVKALQEAMERIEQLEQRLTDAGIA